MKKILFGITSLTLGGAERVLVDLANELSKDYEIVIWTLYGNGQLEKQLNKNVKLKTYVDKSYEQISKFRKKAGLWYSYRLYHLFSRACSMVFHCAGDISKRTESKGLLCHYVE